MMTMVEIEKRDSVIDAVCQELASAIFKYGDFSSAHEGYAVIKEELEELWDLIKAKNGFDNSAYHEAIQVTAMGIKYAMLCKGDNDNEKL